ncbi:MAG: TonB-dependent receptor [Bacteroidota bacterium]
MRKFLLFNFVLSLLLVFSASAQERAVSGRITSAEDGSGLPGVNVVLKGTTTGTVTDIDGNYKLNVPSEGGTLVFSFIGLASQEVEIGARSVLDVQMASDVTELSEVVVQAYGAQSEKLNIQQIETVGSKDFENFPVVSAQELLQGQAAGVQIAGGSGVIGAPQAVRIRGVASINSGTQPLYVIDGVPLIDGSGTNAQNQATAQLGGSALNPLADINPNDIESITVLKDASAVALYGSRGGNGVILITTKKGSVGEATVFSADYYTGWQTPTVVRQVLSPDQWRQFRANISTARGTPSAPSLQNQGGFNWRNAAIQTGRVSNYSLSARGGTDKTAFFVGGTLFDNEGYQVGNELNRLSGRVNITHEASDFVKFGTNISFTRGITDRFFQENSTGSPLTVGLLQLPVLEPVDADGNVVDAGFGNFIASQEQNLLELTTNRLLGNAYVEISPLENLVLRSDWGFDRVSTFDQRRTLDLFAAGGVATQRDFREDKWLVTNTATYTATFGESTLTPLVGFSFEESDQRRVTAQTSGFISDALPNVASGATPLTTSSQGTNWALWGFFGRVNYNYKNRYLLEASVRGDGSSRFGANNRYGVFWSVSGGWIFSDEDFFPSNSIISFGKLSSSYGVTGNDRITNFASLGLFQAGNDYAGVPGLEASQPANPDLTWEETAQFDVNLNVNFLNDRIRLDASYYRKVTTELLLNVPVPATTGFPSITQNAGELVNQGTDLSLSVDVINSGDLTWTVTANAAYLNNEVTELPEGSSEDLDGNRFVALAAFGQQRAVEGGSVSTFFLNRFAGINPANGEPEFLNREGEVTGTLTTADRVIVGQGIPDWTGGLNSELRYKNFDFRIFLNFVTGSDVYAADLEFNRNILSSGGFNNIVNNLDIWTQPGDITQAPALQSDGLANFDNESTQHLIDASFLRVRNMTLGYSVPKSILEASKFLTRARVYVSGTNLFTFFSDLKDDVGLDPEVSNAGVDPGVAQGETFFTSPQARTFTVGVSLGF